MAEGAKRPEIYERISNAMAEVGAIAKSQKNQQQNYKYRGIDDVFNALHPLMSKHGLFVVPKVLERETYEGKSSKGGVLFYTRLIVEYTMYAPDGSSVSGSVMGEAMDSADKSSNKAMSAAMKYWYFQVFCIPIADADDADATTPEPKGFQNRPQRANAPRSDAQGAKQGDSPTLTPEELERKQVKAICARLNTTPDELRAAVSSQLNADMDWKVDDDRKEIIKVASKWDSMPPKEGK